MEKEKLIDLAIDLSIIKKLLKLHLINEIQYNLLKQKLYSESKCNII